MFLIDVQSELSFPAGGCPIDRLVRVATQAGVEGIGLADHASRVAVPGFEAAAAQVGLPVISGVRFTLVDSDAFDSTVPGDVEVVMFPLTAVGEAWIDERIAHGPTVSPVDFPDSGHLSIIIQTHGVVPHDAGPVRQLCFRTRDSLQLALPGPHAPELVALGRDLGIPTVFAPSIRILHAEDAPLHRLLVSIRGDHEGSGTAPRSGRPARSLLCGRQHSLERAVGTAPFDALQRAARFFHRVTSTHSTIEHSSVTDRPESTPSFGPSTSAASHRDASARAHLLAALRDRDTHATHVPRSIVQAEIDSLEELDLLGPLTRLAALLGERHAFSEARVEAPGWAQSWVAWALDLIATAPRADRPPFECAADGPLPTITIQSDFEGAAPLRMQLEAIGGRSPWGVELARADEVSAWLDRAMHDDPIVRRAVAGLVANKQVRGATTARRLGRIAERLDGRPLRVRPEPDMRILGRGGGVPVRVVGSDVLSLLRRRTTPSASVTPPSSTEVPALRLHRIQQLLDGPLASATAPAAQRLIAERRPRTIDDLARCFALSGRNADSPGSILRIGTKQWCIVTRDDLVACLAELEFVEARLAEELVRSIVEDNDSAFDRAFQEVVRHAHELRLDRRVARRFLLDVRIVGAHLVDVGAYHRQADVAAALADWLHDDPQGFLEATLAELSNDFHAHDAAVRWAARHGMTIEATAAIGRAPIVPRQARSEEVRTDGHTHPVDRPTTSGTETWAKSRSRAIERRVG